MTFLNSPLLKLLTAAFLSAVAFSAKAGSVDDCALYSKENPTLLQYVLKKVQNRSFVSESLKTEIGRYMNLSQEEREVIGMNFPLITAIKLADSQVNQIPPYYCGDREYIDTMQDALRHFVLSATLASRVGQKKALELLNAHERGGDGKYTVTNLQSTFMDYNNNAVGAEFGQRYYSVFNTVNGYIIHPEVMVSGFMQALKAGRLRVIKGPLTCANLPMN